MTLKSIGRYGLFQHDCGIISKKSANQSVWMNRLVMHQGRYISSNEASSSQAPWSKAQWEIPRRMPESRLVHRSAKAREVIDVRVSDYNTVLPYSALGTGRQEHSRQGAAVEKTAASLAWKTLCVHTFPRARRCAPI